MRAAGEDSQGVAKRANADVEYKAHLKGVFAMPRVDVRFSQLSATTCELDCTLPGRCLHIRIDGFSQAKGRCLRNLEKASNGQTSGAHSCIVWV